MRRWNVLDWMVATITWIQSPLNFLLNLHVIIVLKNNLCE
jgi:hypothetical protein